MDIGEIALKTMLLGTVGEYPVHLFIISQKGIPAASGLYFLDLRPDDPEDFSRILQIAVGGEVSDQFSGIGFVLLNHSPCIIHKNCFDHGGSVSFSHCHNFSFSRVRLMPL